MHNVVMVAHKVCALLHYIMDIPLGAEDGYMLFSLLLAEKRREHVKSYERVSEWSIPGSDLETPLERLGPFWTHQPPFWSTDGST